MAQREPLKAYERDILRARSRAQVADLDNEIDALIKTVVGKLAKTEYKRYQAARLAELMGDTPEFIVLRRALLLELTEQEMKSLSAPDVLTMEELASLVVIMRAIGDWLLECQAAGVTGVTVSQLIDRAQRHSAEALVQFQVTYHRAPNLTDVPESLMRLPRARNIKKLADIAGKLLPPAQH